MREPIVRKLGGEPAWEGWPAAEVASRGLIQWQTLLGEDPADQAGLVMGVARLHAGEALAPHRHAQAEAYFTLAGRGVLTIEGVPHALEAGTLVWIPANALHTVRLADDAAAGEELRFLYTFAADCFDDVIYRFPPA